MKLLGIDYGRVKVGLAIAESGVSFPFKVIKFDDLDELLRKIVKIVQDENIDKIVLGISEGSMKKEILFLADALNHTLGVPVDFEDETLTSREAQDLSLKAGLKRKRRRSMEDAFAAALLLERYLGFN